MSDADDFCDLLGGNEDNDVSIDFDSADKSFLFSLDNEMFEVQTENMGAYIENWKSQSKKLHFKKINSIKHAYNNFGPVGLFYLFLSKSFFKAILVWTNNILLEKGKQSISEVELNAYVGLELAMSLSHQNCIGDYWSTKPFLGTKGFSEVMSRDVFTSIRSALTFRPPGLDTPDVKHSDPLWHSRTILKELLTNCMSIAAASGVMSFDEASIRTQAKSRAKTYIPSKPEKYAIRLYATNCWGSLYLQNFFDNGVGNYCGLNCSERYVELFPKLRSVLINHIEKFEKDPSILGMEKDKQSWLWGLQMVHITQKHRSGDRKRLVVTDNYYTRPGLAKAAKCMSDGEIRMIGTCRLSFVSSPNKHNIQSAIEKLKKCPRGSWILVAEYEQHQDYTTLRKEHEKEMKKLPSGQRTVFICPCGSIAENSGFVVFMDKKPVIVYTNDLACTMTQTFMESDDSETVKCVHGLVPLRRWTKTESMFRTEFLAPAIFVAYNVFMNGVDRMDQIRAVNPTRRREKRVSMSIFTWAVDIACNNSFSILKSFYPEKTWNMRQFKAEISLALVQPFQSKKKLIKINLPQKRQAPSSFPEVDKIIGSDASTHYLLKNKNGASIECFLCSILSGKRLRSSYACIQCRKGYHVDCFTAVHHQNALDNNRVLLNKILKTFNAKKPVKAKSSRYISSLDDLVLLCESNTEK